MDDIARFFVKSKKRDLSSESKTSEDPKKVKESGSASLSDECDVFAEGLGNEDCRAILFNCLKNLEKDIKSIYVLANDNKASSIKGEKQLVDLTDSVKLISTKFAQYEKDRKEHIEKIKNLRKEVNKLSEKLENAEKKIEDQEQYSRRNCLLIHGIEETDKEKTDQLVLDVINKDMDIDMPISAIERTHRIGTPKQKKKKSRPIIVKFVRYYDRKNVYVNKKRLKGKGISVTESLTKFRMQKLLEARETHGFSDTWTIDGRILYKGENSKPVIYYG